MPSELIAASERAALMRTLQEAVRLLRQIRDRYDVLDVPADLMLDVIRFLATVEGEK